MSRELPLARPLMGAQEERAVCEVLRSRWLVQGTRVAGFEGAVSQFTKLPYAVAVSSCTSALYLCLRAMGIDANDDVLVPAFTFVATANSVVHAGGTPVFVDINLETFNVSAEATQSTIEQRYRRRGNVLLNRATGRRLRTMIVVHQFGLAADLASLGKIARRYGLTILEDAACALGAAYRSLHVGHFGIAACLSFHPRKSISTGEGGMVLTRNRAFARRIRMLRDHGAQQSDHERHLKHIMALPHYPIAGFNSRLTDIQGAVGIEQMKRLPGILSRRERLARRYLNRLEGLGKELILPAAPDPCHHSWQSFVIRISRGMKIRTQIATALRDEGIATRPGTHAVPWLGAFRSSTIDRQACPRSLEAQRTTLTLPLFAEMSLADVDRVAEALRLLVSRT